MAAPAPPPAPAPLPAPPDPAPHPAPHPAPGHHIPICVPRAATADPDQCYVRNSSFLSRDIEAKANDATQNKESIKSPPKKISSPPVKVNSPPVKAASPPVNAVSPPLKAASPPKNSPPKTTAATKPLPPPDVTSQPKRVAVAPPKRESSLEKSIAFPPKTDSTQRKESASPPKDQVPPQNQVTSPPMSIVKLNRSDSKGEENSQPLTILKKESSFAKETVVKTDKLSLVNEDSSKTVIKIEDNEKTVPNSVEKQKSEESNGVGDKIKKFEKAAEDASANATVGRLSRPGSVRGRGRTDRLGSGGSDGKDELPPATPFKDNVHFDLPSASTAPPDRQNPAVERQQTLNKNSAQPNPIAVKWQRNESSSVEVEKVKPEPQKIIKPEFKPMPSSVDATIRSPSLGAKLPEQFPSHGTAFRNVAPDARAHKPADDAHNHLKPCKLKNKEKYSVSKGSSYFTRGSEEIWLVKKKDIEEIEERVLDSFRRAGGNVCMRSESMRPASDGGHASFVHATMGRNKRQMYARSESLDPQSAGARAQTLKRQSSVACTCGHDKKTRGKSASDAPARPRSRSHGDDAQHHVLDKYETLV